jgi:ubiquitin-conjugating enzyme E2 R
LHNDDIFNWDVALIVINPDSMYYGGYFRAKMRFPANYPYAPPGNQNPEPQVTSQVTICHATNKFAPPEFRFRKPLHHPNIYPDGKLCISILHAPGEDEMSGELASERWSPAQRVESVLISIISLLDDAEPSSPANVDAGVLFRKDPAAYRQMVKADVERSKADIPADFVMPTHETSIVREPTEKEDHDFWAESDADSDVFGGSDSDEDLLQQFSDSEIDEVDDDSIEEDTKDTMKA